MFGKQGVRNQLLKIIKIVALPFYIFYFLLPSWQSGVFLLKRLVPYFCVLNVIFLLELLLLGVPLSTSLLLCGGVSVVGLLVFSSFAWVNHLYTRAETTNFYAVWEQWGLKIDQHFSSDLAVYDELSVESMIEKTQRSMDRGSLMDLSTTYIESIFNFVSDGIRFDLEHSLYFLFQGETAVDVMIPVTAGPNGFSEINTCQTTSALSLFLERIHEDVNALIHAQTIKAVLEKSNLTQNSDIKKLLGHLLRVRNAFESFTFYNNNSDFLLQELIGLTSIEEGGNLFLFKLQAGYSLGHTYFNDRNYICFFLPNVHEDLQERMKNSRELKEYKRIESVSDHLLELLIKIIKKPNVPKAIYSDEDMKYVLGALKEVWDALPLDLKKRLGSGHEGLFQLCHPMVYSGGYKSQAIDYDFIQQWMEKETDVNGQNYLPVKPTVLLVLLWSFQDKYLKAPLDANFSPFAAVFLQKINAIEEDVLSSVVPYKALSVVLQLWVAHLNVYCVYYKITFKNVDFGDVLHKQPYLCESLVDCMARALSQGRDVEKDIMGWFFENAKFFEIDSAKFQTMQHEKMNIMISRFKEHYHLVREDMHVDEVMMLMPPREGEKPLFTTYRGQTGILLSRWLTLPVSHLVDKRVKDLLLERFSEVSAGTIVQESHNFKYSNNRVLAGYWWKIMAHRTAELGGVKNFDMRNDPINKDLIRMLKMINKHETEAGTWLANMLKENQNVVSLVNLLLLVCQEERVTPQGRDPEAFFFFTKTSSILKSNLRDAMVANGYFAMQFRKAVLMARGACPSLHAVLQAGVDEIGALPDTSTQNAFLEHNFFEHGSKKAGAVVQRFGS